MDISTLGIVFAIASLVGCIMLENAGIVGSGYLNIPGAVLIFLGTTAAVLASFTLHDTLNVGNWIKVIFFHPVENLREIIESMISFAQKARRDGLLSLEADIENIHDPFFRKGIQLVVDGVDPELIEEILYTDAEKMAARHKVGLEYFMISGGIAPTMGVMGAIMGLAGALGKMGGGDIMTTVHSLAVAFIASFYGVGYANLILFPIAYKLKALHEEEAFAKELIITGVLSIQSGDNPRILEEKFKAFFSAKKYPVPSEEAKGGGH